MQINANGNADMITDYNATGKILLQAEPSSDWFGFTGVVCDASCLWKMGARYYDSSKGSFIQQDRYMGDPKDPLSLNRYIYCGLDPVNYVDPTGFEQISTTTPPSILPTPDPPVWTTSTGTELCIPKITRLCII